MLFTVGRVLVRSSARRAPRWSVARSLPRFGTSKLNAPRCFTQTSTTNEPATESGTIEIATEPKAKVTKATVKTTKAKKSTKTTKAKAGKKKPAKKAKKPKAKKVAKPKRKTTSKASLAKLAREEKAALLDAALLDEPKIEGAHPYRLFVVQKMGQKQMKSREDTVNAIKEIAAEYRHLSVSEKATLEKTAQANKASSEVDYDKWVKSHSAVEIQSANAARRKLRALAKKSGKPVPGKYSEIKDERKPKRPMTAMLFYFNENYTAGNFPGLTSVQAIGESARQFKNLSPSQRKTYDDLAQRASEEYVQAYRATYNTDPPSVKRAEAAA